MLLAFASGAWGDGFLGTTCQATQPHLTQAAALDPYAAPVDYIQPTAMGMVSSRRTSLAHAVRGKTYRLVRVAKTIVAAIS